MTYEEGDHSAGICPECRKLVHTTFRSSGESPTVLIAFCNECDVMVAIPHQSTPKINAKRDAGGVR